MKHFNHRIEDTDFWLGVPVLFSLFMYYLHLTEGFTDNPFRKKKGV